MKKPKMYQLAIRLEAVLLERLQRAADRDRRPLASMIRCMLEDALNAPAAAVMSLDHAAVVSPNQAMQALLVSRATLYSLINSGELESYTEGRSRRIIATSLDAYIARRLEAERGRKRAKAAR